MSFAVVLLNRSKKAWQFGKRHCSVMLGYNAFQGTFQIRGRIALNTPAFCDCESENLADHLPKTARALNGSALFDLP